ncbi:MAG: hypothetical protein V4757_04230 [Pseudomonadota bacterium]
MPSIAILGSGFGLYGYLPALASDSSVEFVLPLRSRASLAARAELAPYVRKIHWAADERAALQAATTVVMALRPEAQASWLRYCLELDTLQTLLLEKPLAPAPGLAQELASGLRASGKTWRIGYLFRFMDWAAQLREHVAGLTDRSTAHVDIRWEFLAHHYRHNVSTWKTDPARGGGALHFYGIHLVALLAEAGYDTVVSSRGGAGNGDAATWVARFRGPALPDCTVAVDSKAASSRFSVVQRSSGNATPVVELADPFEEAQAVAGLDRRVSALAMHCMTATDGQAAYGWYDVAIDLWRQAEGKSRHPAQTISGEH